MTSTVDKKQLHNKNPELHNDSGENSEKVTSFISTVDIDERIIKALMCDGEDEFIYEQVSNLKSIIRELAEESFWKDNGNGDWHKNTDGLTCDEWHLLHRISDEQRTKLNKILGSEK